MSAKRKKHEDTRVSLHPLGFEEAVRRLAEAPKTPDLRTRSGGHRRSAKRGRSAQGRSSA